MNNLINTQPSNNETFYYGFGGWLYLISGLQIITSISIVSTLFNTLDLFGTTEWINFTDPESVDYLSYFELHTYTALIINILLIISIILIAITTLTRSKLYAPAQITFLILFFICYAVDSYLMDLTNKNNIYEPYSETNLLMMPIASIILAVIWILYFMKSKRVKNTFSR